ncbi:MAG: FAD-dependent thymidylate synthase [Candidatus Geothermarchaeales archaeon]
MPTRQLRLTDSPTIGLRQHFSQPTLDSIAAARTCYSPRIIAANEVTQEQVERIGRTTYEGGHHSVYQHQFLEFELEDVSTVLTHDILHNHPFYNSSQQSQRYVDQTRRGAVMPPLEGKEARAIYEDAVRASWDAYAALTETLAEDLMGRLAASNMDPASRRRRERDVRKKAMEAARYALVIGCHTSLIYTIDGVTLWRLYRLKGLSWEAERVVSMMVDAVREVDPRFFDRVNAEMKARPLPTENTLEGRLREEYESQADMEAFRKSFDESLRGYRSKLVGWTRHGEERLADALSYQLGLPPNGLTKEETVAHLLDPGKNPYLLESLNLAVVSPAMATMSHIHYSFKKRISHVADCQDQRHRMVPASRPLSRDIHPPNPDYVTPILIEGAGEAKKLFEGWMGEAWERKNELEAEGVLPEHAVYVLPRAVAVRLVESGTLLHLFYKFYNRTCLRTQEELWITTMQERNQVAEVHPLIGERLGPPCHVRNAEPGEIPEEWGKVNLCNQGKLYCGKPVWNLWPEVHEQDILDVI